MEVKQQIQALLAQVETLLEEATCEGVQLAELEGFEEVDVALAHLQQTVDYYVDWQYNTTNNIGANNANSNTIWS